MQSPQDGNFGSIGRMAGAVTLELRTIFVISLISNVLILPEIHLYRCLIHPGLSISRSPPTSLPASDQCQFCVAKRLLPATRGTLRVLHDRTGY